MTSAVKFQFYTFAKVSSSWPHAFFAPKKGPGFSAPGVKGVTTFAALGGPLAKFLIFLF